MVSTQTNGETSAKMVHSQFRQTQCGFALCGWFLSAQLDLWGHNRALGEAGTVQSKHPAGSLDPKLDGCHEPVLWDKDVNMELGGQRKQSGKTLNQSGHLRFTNMPGQNWWRHSPGERIWGCWSKQVISDTAEWAQIQTPTEQSSHHQWFFTELWALDYSSVKWRWKQYMIILLEWWMN